jgi:hypothetical protein
MLAKHYPNYLLPYDAPSIILSKSGCKNNYFSVSVNGYFSNNSVCVIIFVTSLIIGEKFGELNEPPISNLFSPGVLSGDFLPSKKSHAFSMKWFLKKKSSPINSSSVGGFYSPI